MGNLNPPKPAPMFYMTQVLINFDIHDGGGTTTPDDIPNITRSVLFTFREIGKYNLVMQPKKT